MNIVNNDTGEITQSIDLAALHRPFSSAAVEQREGGGNRKFNYIAVETCIRRLNEAVQEWSFRMVPGTMQWLDGGIDRNSNQSQVLMVVGELTIPGLGSRQGIGIQRVIVPIVNSEDMIKGALGDALKKAATLFGVALELYGPDLDAMGGPRDGQRTEPQAQRPDPRDREEIERQHQRNTRPAPSSLPVTRSPAGQRHGGTQQPDGQDRARANVEEKMTARGLPVLPTDTYDAMAETVNRALANAGIGIEVRTDANGHARPGDILNALMALPSAVPAHS